MRHSRMAIVPLCLLALAAGIAPHARPASAAPDDTIPAPPALPYPDDDPLMDSEAVGTLPDSHSVGPTGELSYVLPLDVPVGRAGMQPALAIRYGDHGQNGLLGVGFSIDGLSSINRCHQSWAVEGYPDGIDFDSTDRFCLDGQKLVQINPQIPYGADGAEYRTEQESYYRIRAHGDEADGPDGFTVWARDGRILEYSTIVLAARSDADPDMLTAGFEDEPVKYVWLLTEIQDRSGNAIRFTYTLPEKPAFPVEYRPDTIEYTAREQEPGGRLVKFQYEEEDRPDPIRHCVSGVCETITRRMTGIQFFAPDPHAEAPGDKKLAWSYQIDYGPDVSPDTGRSRIAAIRKCDANDTCLKAKELDWWQLGGAPEFASEAFGPTFQVREDQPSFLHVLDVNGDGLDDILYQFGDGSSVQPVPIYLRIALKEPSGGVAFGPQFQVNAPGHLFAATDLPRSRAVDYDADGRFELFAAVDPFTNDPTLIDSGQLVEAGYLMFRWNSNSASFEPASGNGQYFFPANPANDVAQLIDVDGDGWLDMFRELTPETGSTPDPAWFFYPAGASGFAADEPTGIFSSQAIHARALDLDADGRGELLAVDFASLPGGTSDGTIPGQTLALGRNDDGAIAVNPAFRLSDLSFMELADLDGDGLKDALYPVSDTGVDVEVRLNNGRRFGSVTKMADAVWHMPFGLGDAGRRVGDFDGDGADDILTFGEVDDAGQPTVRLHLSRRDHFAPAADLGFASGFMNPQAGWTTSKLGDFNGDGLTDVATFVHNGTWTDDTGTHPLLKLRILRQDRGSPLYVSDRLHTVSDEGNPAPSIEVHYANLQAITSGPVSTCAYPRRCKREAFPVVRTILDAAGGPTGLARRRVYSYEHPVVDVRGRGFLGFETVREFDLQRQSETITTFDNKKEIDGVYPFAGLPKQVRQILPIFPVETDPTVEFPSVPIVGLEARVIETTYFHEAVWTWPHVYTVQPSNVTTHTWEQGVAIGDYTLTLLGDPHDERAVVQTFQYDGYGNIKYLASMVAGVDLYSSTTIFYENRDQEWLLGLPVSRSTTSYDANDPAPEPRRTDYQFDAKGLLEKTILEPTHPELTITTSVVRNDDGQVIGIHRSTIDGTRSTFLAYDDQERIFVRAGWNQLGHAYRAVHDPALGVPVVARDVNDVETRYRYDRFGRLRHIDPDGGMETSLSYASAQCVTSAAQKGMCIEASTEDGGLRVAYLDEVGRPWETAVLAFDGDTLARTRMAYNVLGQRTYQGRPSAAAVPSPPPVGVATITQYDTLGRILSVTAPDGATSTFVHTMSQSHANDPVGRRSYVKRDTAGRVYEAGDIGDDGYPVRTLYDHGPFSQVELILPPDFETVFLEYDKLGQRTHISDPDSGERTFEYNAFGELKQSVDDVHTISFQRDVLGRVFTRSDTHDAGGVPVTESSMFIYDNGPGAIGRMSAAYAFKPDATSLSFEYDTFGRPTKTQWQVADSSFAIEQTYDDIGRPELLRYPAIPGEDPGLRFTLLHQYTTSGHVRGVGRPDAGVPPQDLLWGIKQRTIDGQIGMAHWENGATETRLYDWQTGRLDTVFTNGNADIFALHYEYLPDGNIESREDLLSGRLESFTYDALNRLQTYTLAPPGDPQSEIEKTFEYDDINRLQRVFVNGTEKETFFHADPVKPRAVSGMIDASGAQKTFEYDALGRQTHRDGELIEWTSFDLPRLIEGPKGGTIFSYDPFGNRVRKATNDEETITLAGLYERRESSDSVTHVFYVHGTEGPVAQLVRRKTAAIETEEMQYLQRDAHGSVGLVFDKEGNELPGGRIYFDPFGQRIDEAGNPTSPTFDDVQLGYTGHRHDDELGLIDMGGRVYDPAQRRFLTPDPLVNDPTFGPAYNRYAYVLGNPLAFTDPSGFKIVPVDHAPPPPSGQPPVTCHAEDPKCGSRNPPDRAGGMDPSGRKNPVSSSTGAGATPPTGSRSEQGPSMSDAPAFDAERVAAEEHERSLMDRAIEKIDQIEEAHRGLEDGAIEIVIETIIGTVVTGIQYGAPEGARLLGIPPPVLQLPDAPELTGNHVADSLLHMVPIVRIGQGFAQSAKLWMQGDYYGSGRAAAAPQGELAMVAFGALLGAGAGSFARGPNASTYVYQLVNEAGEPVYYGITNNPIVRLAQHARLPSGPFNGMQVISDALALPQAQALETSLIQQAHAEGRLIYNVANSSISPTAPVAVPPMILPGQTLLNPRLYLQR